MWYQDLFMWCDSSPFRATVCKAKSRAGNAAKSSPGIYSSHEKECGSQFRIVCSVAPLKQRASVSNMKAASIRIIPRTQKASDRGLGNAPEFVEVKRVPVMIMSKATNIGAITGPHQGTGSKNKISQSNSLCGQPVRSFRKT